MKKILFLILFICSMSHNIFASTSKEKNIVLYGDNFTVSNEQTYNNITIFGGNLTVQGTVLDNITLFGGDLKISKSAKISGTVNIFGGNLITEPGAKVPENFNTTSLPTELSSLITTPGMLFSSITFLDLFKINFNITRHLIFIILGLLSIWFFEKRIISMINGLENKPLTSFGYGLLSWVLFFPIFILLIISLIGIILVPFLILYYFVASIFGWAAISCSIGEKISQKWLSNKRHYITFLIGIILIMLISLIPILSLLITIIGSIFALGTVFMTKFGQRYEAI